MQCLICSHPVALFSDEKLAVETCYCTQCGCFFKSPTTHQSIEAQKQRYDLHENHEEDPGYRRYFQRFLDFVLPLVGSPATALDFGCGSSTLLAKMLEAQGVVCEAYDPLYHPDTQYHSKKYELIVSTEVFEHLHDPGATFGVLLDRLEEGGYMAIQTAFAPESIAAYRRWYYRQDPTHIVFFATQTFKELCRRSRCVYLGDNGKNMLVIKKHRHA